MAAVPCYSRPHCIGEGSDGYSETRLLWMRLFAVGFPVSTTSENSFQQYAPSAIARFIGLLRTAAAHSIGVKRHS